MTDNPSCFNAVLRRLLCSGNVPTHPSLDSTPDHSNPPTKTSTCPNHDNKPKLQSLASSPSIKPGIVARLMGLDSLPESNWVIRNPDSSFNRSKSVSFADYLMGFDNDDHVASVAAAPASLHRRVKTSVSFREAPAVLSSHHRNEGHEFLVVYLDENIKKKTEEVKQGKKKEEIFKKKEEKLVKRNVSGAQSDRGRKAVSKKGGDNLREGSGEHTPLQKTKKKVEIINPKLNKKKKHQNEAKRREAAENSSPVSVLDIDDVLVQHETWLSEYNSSPKDLKSLMKSPPRASYNEDPEMRAVKFKDMETVKSRESEDYTEVLASKILKLTEEELRETKWVSNNEVKIEMLEEIYVEVEAVILEVLLNQVIDDLVQLS